MTKYLIFDFNALFHRSRNALMRTGRKFSSPDGVPTTGVFSSLSTVLSLVKEFPDYKVIVVTEGEGSTASRKEDSGGEYKAHRGPCDKEFTVEITLALQALSYLYPVLSFHGLEGDDTITRLAKSLGQDDEAIIYSCDRDLLPLVNHQVKALLFTTQKKRKLRDLSEVKEAYCGLHGDDLYYVKAMTGDSSDNISGIKGVGLKTAISLYKSEGKMAFESLKFTSNKLVGNEEVVRNNLKLVLPKFCNQVPEPQALTWPLNSEGFNSFMAQLGIKKVKHG